MNNLHEQKIQTGFCTVPRKCRRRHDPKQQFHNRHKTIPYKNAFSRFRKCRVQRNQANQLERIPKSLRFYPNSRILGFNIHSRSSKRTHLFRFIAVVIVIAAVSWQFRSFWDSPSCLSPFKAPLLKESEIFDAAYQKEMFWGTYRPGLYLGLRTRSPSGLMGGLTWTGASEINYIHQIRHDAQQEDIQYQWDVHNGRDFGIQSIYDKELDINFTTTWIQQATDWTLRISTSSSRSKPVSFFFYIADEASSYERRDWDLMDAFVAPNGNWMFSGKHSEIREWQLGLHSPQLKQLKIYRAGYPVEHYHNLTEFMKHVLHDSIGFQYYMQTTKNKEALELRLHDPPAWMESSTEQPNFAILQIIGTPPFSFDLAFLNEDLSDEHFPSLVGSNLDVLIAKRKKEFEERFQKTFKKAGMEEKERLTMQGALSNLLGGMGYFYGNSRVRFPSKDGLFKIKDRFKAALFTSVPSRSFFPRGFLWDEGFHLLLIHKWDPLIAMDVLAHWLDLISRDGWIPREQILGEEARSRVPSEFVTQDPSVGNPPTFFLVLLEMADRPNDVTKAFLKQAWPRLKIWFLWMIENHRGSKEGTFRWTSREVSEEKLNPLTLDSGLDDFPRASHPDPQEYHLDLRCWIALAAKAMKTIGKTLQLPENELELYQNLTTTLTDMEELKKLHYDPEWGWFLDFGFHSENVVLEGRTVLTSNGEKVRFFLCNAFVTLSFRSVVSVRSKRHPIFVLCLILATSHCSLSFSKCFLQKIRYCSTNWRR